MIVRCLGFVLFLVFLTGCTRKASIPGGTIVFLGDSITAGYGLEPEQAYPALIEIKGMTMLNMGVSGTKTEDGLISLKNYLETGGSPQLVVIALGANDILQGVQPQVIEANLTGMIRECKERHVRVLLCGIWIPFKFGSQDVFPKTASENEVPLLGDLMQGEETQTSLLQDDGMHPNAAGQKIIARAMRAALLKSFSFSGR